ncbi:MAG: alpha-ketoglutarate-dependent dioxygenase AlkB [Nitrospiraceae bacterium]
MPSHIADRPPLGLLYHSSFISTQEESDLIEQVRHLPFYNIKMHGVIAKRQVIHFGWVYGYESRKITLGPPLPAFLTPLRARAAELIDRAPGELAEVLITQYPPGAGIGWRRDAPMFGTVVGISLLNACRFSFQRGEATERETFSLMLEPRSAYVPSGTARDAWQQSIHRTAELRYSVTFRTVREVERHTGSGNTV